MDQNLDENQFDLNEEESSFDFMSILNMFIFNWKIFALSVIVCLGLGVLFLKVKSPEYQVSTKMLIKEEGKKMTGLSSRMKNLLPKISDYPNVEVVVDNDILLNELQSIKGRIRATLAKALGNGNIELHLRLAKVEEVKVLMTKRDVLNELKANYPGVRLLYESLGLEMS